MVVEYIRYTVPAAMAQGFSDDVFTIAAALPVWACTIRKVTAARHAASATRGLRSRLRGQLRH